MTIDGEDDVQGLMAAGAAVAEARDTVLAAVAPGVTTGELDTLAREVLDRHGARSAPKLAYRFPGTICVSVNDRIAHGIPSATHALRSGDLVNVDVSAELDGYWADTGASAPVGTVDQEALRLLEATRLANRDAMKVARAGRPLRHIGRAVERRARKHGFRVVADLCGHGVGRHIHEEPSVPNVEQRRDDTVLWEGLVIAIEPFLSPTATSTWTDGDGWSLRTNDGSRGAQFEHTIVVTNGAPLVVTAPREAALPLT
jgi:methionyl aminopeptidase